MFVSADAQCFKQKGQSTCMPKIFEPYAVPTVQYSSVVFTMCSGIWDFSENCIWRVFVGFVTSHFHILTFRIKGNLKYQYFTSK
jgi:hypothetical protein